MSSHILIQDPNSLSTRFSNKDRLGYEEIEDVELGELIKTQLAPDEEREIGENNLLDFASIEHFLRRIPAREADLITLYHKDRMKQEQIAKLFNITQAAVSYRLHRGIRRIQFLRTIPDLDRDQFELELGPKFSDQDREILWRMYETTCQSETAKQMSLTQGRVRHRFFRALDKIKSLIADEIREKKTSLQIKARKQMELRQNQARKAQNGFLKNPNSSLDAQEIAHAKQEVDDHVSSVMGSEEVLAEISLCIDNSKYAKYWTVFFAISDKHFNILHEVSLPQFRDRGDAQILTME